MSMWQYRARPIRAIDGDTVAVTIDLGFKVRYETTLRLLDVRAPEMVGADRARGVAAKVECQHWLDAAGVGEWPLLVDTFKDKTDKYGRFVAVVTRVRDGRSLNFDMTEWLVVNGGEGGK
jgi:micrococcal nuclease